jgi:hypothetical protein
MAMQGILAGTLSVRQRQGPGALKLPVFDRTEKMPSAVVNVHAGKRSFDCAAAQDDKIKRAEFALTTATEVRTLLRGT